MKKFFVPFVLFVVSGVLAAQEPKPVPKDSMRVSIPGCHKGYVFTVGRRTADEPGSRDFPEGMHLRMNGPKKLMSDLTAHKGGMIEITGLMKKDDYPQGVSIGGVRIAPGSTSGVTSTPLGSQIPIDVESWRSVPGSCPR